MIKKSLAPDPAVVKEMVPSYVCSWSMRQNKKQQQQTFIKIPITEMSFPATVQFKCTVIRHMSFAVFT